MVGQGVNFADLPVGTVFCKVFADGSGVLTLRKISETGAAVVANAPALAQVAHAQIKAREWSLMPEALYIAPEAMALQAGPNTGTIHTYQVETKAQKAAAAARGAALAGGQDVRDTLANLPNRDFLVLAKALHVDPPAGADVRQNVARAVDAMLAADPQSVKDAAALAVLGRLQPAIVKAWRAYAQAINPAPAVPAGMVRGR